MNATAVPSVAPMAREPKKKIALGPSAPGLQQPFAALRWDGLPDGPAAAPGPAAPAAAESVAPIPAGGRVVLRRERAHRSGKTVIVISGFAPETTPAAIAGLAGTIRHACGCGGTVRGREIEIQGDQPERVRRVLEGAGLRVAGVGGG